MTNEELLGKHNRLREELSAAYAQPVWDTAYMQRVTSELAAVERLLSHRAGRQATAIRLMTETG